MVKEGTIWGVWYLMVDVKREDVNVVENWTDDEFCRKLDIVEFCSKFAQQ